MSGRLAASCLALLLAGCGVGADPATPALWQADCPGERQAWLFGTVHALERPAEWRGEIVDKAMAESSVLMVELADPGNAKASAEAWERLSKSPGRGPLSLRLPPSSRDELAGVLEKTGLDDSAHGIDSAVIDTMRGTRIVELEGREPQLAIFDTLPEKEQRDLLAAVVSDAAQARDEAADIASAWRRGDMTAIARATTRGMLADPQLRTALFTARNQRWSAKVQQAMDDGDTPFVAVGAAHLAGSQGLPAMLRASGCAVERAQ
jgi:uncharacterized protein YbaP (TraB family)